MGIVASLIQYGVGRLPGMRHVSKWEWGAKGFSAAFTAGIVGVAAHHAHYSFGHEYGSGTTALYAAASIHPITGIPLGILEGGKLIGEAAFAHQQAKRRSSFAKPAVPDRFGTIHQMRQRSIQQLNRDHTSKQRILGNEAYYLHR